MPDKQQFTFQTEIKQLLQILSRSLYQNREITIRELVSNASDALNKLRHVQLTDEKLRDDTPLEITLEPDKDAKTLTIRDNGIGMTRDELIENLGTIAHSGSLAFLNRLTGDAQKDLSLIGQFGVGFYSAFMLADNVEVLSRSYTEDTGWRWESDGSGEYTIEPAEGLERGTQVRLHLKDDCTEFTGKERLKYVIRRYSTFVPYPIQLDGEQLNEQRPIWVEPKTSLTDDDYNAFYQHLTHTDDKPLWHLHVAADSPFQFHAILYCPANNFERLGFGRIEHGMHLCAKRILVQDDCRDLLPDYLRFVYGLVDSADLPLNVGRESLQDNTVFRRIRKVLVKRVLDQLDKVADQEAETYDKFIREFGVILREGIATDFEHRDHVAKLLRFRTSQGFQKIPGMSLTSLDAYLERAPEDQKQIYFLTGPDAAAMQQNPNLEIFRKKDIEVLLLTDPVDEIVLSTLGKYKDKELTSIDAADIELPELPQGGAEDAKEEEEKGEPESGFGKVLVLFKEALGDRVVDVKESKRLTDSPACLVNADRGMSAQLEKVMQMSHEGFQMSKRILEINPRAPLIRRLCQLSANSDHDEFLRNCGRQLFSNAMLLDGMADDPRDLVTRTQQFMAELAEKRSPIVT